MSTLTEMVGVKRFRNTQSSTSPSKLSILGRRLIYLLAAIIKFNQLVVKSTLTHQKPSMVCRQEGLERWKNMNTIIRKCLKNQIFMYESTAYYDRLLKIE